MNWFVAAGLAAATATAALSSPLPGGAGNDHELRFRPVLAEVPPVDANGGMTDPEADAAIASCDVAALEALASIPTTEASADDAEACVVLEPHDPEVGSRFFLGRTTLTEDDVRRAKRKSVGGQYVINLRLTKAGLEELNDLAVQLFPKPPPQNQVAIVLDGVVLSAPAFQATEFDDVVVITGDFTRREARSIAGDINRANED
jgi:preprotein translocase subunit SecD